MSELISAIDQDKLRQEELKNMEEEKKNMDNSMNYLKGIEENLNF